MTDFAPLPTLIGSGMQLRQLTVSDDADLLRIFGDRQVARFMGIPLLTDLAGAALLRERVWRGAHDRTLFQWGVSEEGSEQLLGTCTLASISWENERAEIGFALGSAYWRQGYMSRAVPVLLDYAFNELGLHRIEADVDPRNVSSLRLLERLGFEREGLLPGRHLIAGERQDTVMFGLLAPCWLVVSPRGRYGD